MWDTCSMRGINSKRGIKGSISREDSISIENSRSLEDCIDIKDSVSVDNQISLKDSLGNKISIENSIGANLRKSIEDSLRQPIKNSIGASISHSWTHKRSTSCAVSASLTHTQLIAMAHRNWSASVNERQTNNLTALTPGQVTIKGGGVGVEDSVGVEDGWNNCGGSYRIGVEDSIRGQTNIEDSVGLKNSIEDRVDLEDSIDIKTSALSSISASLTHQLDHLDHIDTSVDAFYSWTVRIASLIDTPCYFIGSACECGRSCQYCWSTRLAQLTSINKWS